MYLYYCYLYIEINLAHFFLQEEENKKDSNETQVKTNESTVKEILAPTTNSELTDTNNSDLCKSPVRTRSQNKMEPVKNDKPKPVKKTVTFGTVESCEDTFPLKKLPIKSHAPLVSIIKKKSMLKQTEYSMFSSILKPAKLTDLSSKSSLEYQEGYLRKNLNPLSKPSNKFSQLHESRALSPPPRNASPDKESTSPKFVLPVRSAHSSRVIKPNKKFIDGEDINTNSTTSSITSSKVLKKPKLKQLVFNNLLGEDETPEDEDIESNESVRQKDKLLLNTSNIFKEKPVNSFSGLNSNNKKAGRDLFNYGKEESYAQDENSNVEPLDRLNCNESHKDDRGGHALRKLMDISDASSTSSTSSGSESEESWESDSPSGEETEHPSLPSPERDKAPASQLLSGKVIIREARLQLNSTVQSTLGPDGPFSTFTGSSCKFVNIVLRKSYLFPSYV